LRLERSFLQQQAQSIGRHQGVLGEPPFQSRSRGYKTVPKSTFVSHLFFSLASSLLDCTARKSSLLAHPRQFFIVAVIYVESFPLFLLTLIVLLYYKRLLNNPPEVVPVRNGSSQFVFPGRSPPSCLTLQLFTYLVFSRGYSHLGRMSQWSSCFFPLLSLFGILVSDVTGPPLVWLTILSPRVSLSPSGLCSGPNSGACEAHIQTPYRCFRLGF